ncbi:MAG: short-chain dehydrogenase [Chloroflexi bacterium]|nr:short-chain dehydrogenase [Chloroflexota bacterium]
MDLELRGKTAIVTGGSRGIGKAIGREFGLEGVSVALVSRGQEALEETARELAEETGGNFITIVADTGDPESVQAMVKEAAERLGRIDILVNSAARVSGTYSPKLADITEDDFWGDMNVKVMGYLRCAQAVAPYMIEQGWGRIINLSGMAARQSGYSVGSMRNVSVAALTKNLADELGPKGINATVVHPGLTYTERIPGMLEDQAKAQGITVEEAERRMAERNSIQKMVDAREVAYVVAFLASPKSISINGDTIAAGGGVGRAIHY